MCKKVFLGLLLVGLQGGLEDSFEAFGSFGCGCCLGHYRNCGTVGGPMKLCDLYAMVGMRIVLGIIHRLMTRPNKRSASANVDRRADCVTHTLKRILSG